MDDDDDGKNKNYNYDDNEDGRFTLRQTQREKGRVSRTISIDIEVSTWVCHLCDG